MKIVFYIFLTSEPAYSHHAKCKSLWRSIHRLWHYSLDLAQLPAHIIASIAGSEALASPDLCRTKIPAPYLSFHYLICDLSTLPFERFRDSDNVVVRLNLPNMKYAAESRVEVYAQAVRGLLRKFGHRLTEDDRRRVETADAETLLKWSDKILSANSIEEILHLDPRRRRAQCAGAYCILQI